MTSLRADQDRAAKAAVEQAFAATVPQPVPDPAEARRAPAGPTVDDTYLAPSPTMPDVPAPGPLPAIHQAHPIVPPEPVAARAPPSAEDEARGRRFGCGVLLLSVVTFGVVGTVLLWPQRERLLTKLGLVETDDDADESDEPPEEFPEDPAEDEDDFEGDCPDFEACQRACERDRNEDCKRLAQMYRTGTSGAPRRTEIALQLYLRSCDDDEDGDACTAAGLMMMRREVSASQDPREGLLRMIQGCGYGDGQGCWRVGRAYEEGTGVPEDHDKAHEYYVRGCVDLEHPDACVRGRALAERDHDRVHERIYRAKGCQLGVSSFCEPASPSRTDGF
jgi:hypothetical protein